MGKEKKVDYVLGLVAAAINFICGIVYIVTGSKLIFALIHLAVAFALVIMLYLIKKNDDEIDRIISEMVKDSSNYNMYGSYKDLKFETMPVPGDSTIVLQYTYDMDFDHIKNVFNDVTAAFPNNAVVAIPDKTTMNAMNIEQLKDVLTTVQTAIDYASGVQPEPEEVEKEEVVETEETEKEEIVE